MAELKSGYLGHLVKCAESGFRLEPPRSDVEAARQELTALLATLDAQAARIAALQEQKDFWRTMFEAGHKHTVTRTFHWRMSDSEDEGTRWDLVETKLRTASGRLREPVERVVLRLDGNGRRNPPKATAENAKKIRTAIDTAIFASIAPRENQPKED